MIDSLRTELLRYFGIERVTHQISTVILSEIWSYIVNYILKNDYREHVCNGAMALDRKSFVAWTVTNQLNHWNPRLIMMLTLSSLVARGVVITTTSGAIRYNEVVTLQWRHNERDGVSNHQPHDCLLNRLLRRRPKKTPKFRVTGLCEGNSPVTGEFPAQRASNAENVSIWWRHHAVMLHGLLKKDSLICWCYLRHINVLSWNPASREQRSIR